MHLWKQLSIGLIVWAACASYSPAGGPCCQRCGCQDSCRKVCRLVCEMKETVKTTYSCVCDDVCVPGPSKNCVSDCDRCSQPTQVPTCARVKTRKLLVKHEEKVQRPTYRWVVEYVCDGCAACTEK